MERQMHKILIFLAVAVVLIGAAAIFIAPFFQTVDVRPYERLKDPAIRKIPATRVMQITFELPSSELGKMYGVLFKSYFSTKGTPKGRKMQPPATRYINTIDFDMAAQDREGLVKQTVWKGMTGIPVPGTVTELKVPKNTSGMKVEITDWQYGETAEILHIGPYEKEAPTVRRLHDFIDAQGYEIAGLHEEVYLKGPGNPLVKPADYYTIIRYPVRPKK